MPRITPERIMVFAISLALAAFVAVTAVNYISAQFDKIENAFEQAGKGGR